MTIVNNIVGVSIEILCNFERRSFVSHIQELNVELEVGNKNVFIRNVKIYNKGCKILISTKLMYKKQLVGLPSFLFHILNQTSTKQLRDMH